MIETGRGPGDPGLSLTGLEGLSADSENKEKEQIRLFSLALGIPQEGVFTTRFEVRTFVFKATTKQEARKLAEDYIPENVSLGNCPISILEMSEEDNERKDGKKKYSMAIGAIKYDSSRPISGISFYKVTSSEDYYLNDEEALKGGKKKAKEMYPRSEGYRKHLVSVVAVPQ